MNLYLKSSIWGTLCDINCLYSETQVMLKLARRAKGHFMTLIEIPMHLIRCKPGHISKNCDKTLLKIILRLKKIAKSDDVSTLA